MPSKKGGKRQQKRQEGETRDADVARQLLLRQEGEEYALLYRELGNRTFSAFCFDGRDRRAVVPKSVRQRLGAGSVVLVGLRAYASADDVCDILHAYYKDEIKQLVEFGHVQGSLEAIMEQKRGGESVVGGLRPGRAREPEEETVKVERVDVDDL